MLAPMATSSPPIDLSTLTTDEAREAAFDAIASWFVEGLARATNDDEARAIVKSAVSSFYDVRETFEQERGEYAGHFFMADGVGLEDTGREVPFMALAKRV